MKYTKYYKSAKKEQYKGLSLRWHPDKCVNTERETVAEEAFKYMESLKDVFYKGLFINDGRVFNDAPGTSSGTSSHGTTSLPEVST